MRYAVLIILAVATPAFSQESIADRLDRLESALQRVPVIEQKVDTLAKDVKGVNDKLDALAAKVNSSSISTASVPPKVQTPTCPCPCGCGVTGACTCSVSQLVE